MVKITTTLHNTFNNQNYYIENILRNYYKCQNIIKLKIDKMF